MRREYRDGEEGRRSDGGGRKTFDFLGAELFDRRFATDVLVGLSSKPKFLPSKYLYDAEGSRLFQQIMELPEYYLTRCEFEILQSYGKRLVEILGGSRFQLVELGAGDGRKTRLLLECFLESGLDFRYVPIDICREAVQGLTGKLRACYPNLDMEGLVCEYPDGLTRLTGSSLDGGGCTLVLFLGSTIGNLGHAEAKTFMHSLRKALRRGDYALIGFDLKKEIRLMVRAYDDSEGVTGRFNLNILRRINRELGSDFNPDRFMYFTGFNVHSGAVESFLVSREKQRVRIGALNQSITFGPWEPLQTESSYKYLVSDVESIAFDSGFIPVEHAMDSRGYFVDSLWQVP